MCAHVFVFAHVDVWFESYHKQMETARVKSQMAAQYMLSLKDVYKMYPIKW